MAPTSNSRLELSLANQTLQLCNFLKQPNSIHYIKFFHPGVWSTFIFNSKTLEYGHRHGVLCYLPTNIIHYKKNPLQKMIRFLSKTLSSITRTAAGDVSSCSPADLVEPSLFFSPSPAFPQPPFVRAPPHHRLLALARAVG